MISAQKSVKHYKVLLTRVMSEKTVIQEANCCYVFKVAGWATKTDIKKAIEFIYKVQVKGVRVLNQLGKSRRTRNGLGKKSDFRKAYVALMDGQMIQSFTQSEKHKEEA